MKILVNYDPLEQNYLNVLRYYIKEQGYEALSTSRTHSISQLIDLAKTSGCHGIFLCNEKTLANVVPGTPTLNEYRGSRLDYSIPVIVGNSLAQINTVDHGRFLLETDLKKFNHLKEKTNKEFTFKVLETLDTFKEAKIVLKDSLFLVYDIETVTVSPEGTMVSGENDEIADAVENGTTIITCISYTAFTRAGKFVTYVLPFFNFMEPHWISDWEFKQAILFMQEINATDIPKCMHNGMYDCLHSIVYRAWPRNFCLDTMGMAHAQYVSLPKSLDFVASITLPDYRQWKQQAKEASRSGDIRQYWEYNGRDTFNTARICLYYLRHLPIYARRNYATQFKLVYPSLYCGFEGFLIDNDKRKELRAEREKELDKALAELQIMTDDIGDITAKKKVGFNPGSYRQVQFYIYDILGAKDPKIGYKKLNGKKQRIERGTDEKNLAAVGEQHPILYALTSRIIKYRENRKAIGTYFDFIQKNGRLLYNINPFGTETERMASRKSSFWCGTQVQNIPYYAKAMLIADPGYVLCEPDNSQSEARCTAYLAQDTHLITALETPGRDFYRTLGTLFFGMVYEDVTTEFRNLVLKKIVHGTNYMMGADTFIVNAGIENLLFAANVLGVRIGTDMSLKVFASHLLDKYHEPFKRIRAWYAEVKNEIRTTSMLVSPLGHTRFFFGDIDKKHQIFSSAVAHGPQNLSVTILNKGWWRQWQLQKREPVAFRMKAQIHDSAPFQYLEGREDIRKEAIECFNNPTEVRGRILRIPVDYKEGRDWGHMKKGV
jgi:DNA polymerase I-like protein with 3'-5' exonuclease and polymerase domains